MLKEDKSPKALVQELGLEQVSDEGAIAAIVDEVLTENPQSIIDFKGRQRPRYRLPCRPGHEKIPRQSKPGYGQ